MRTPTGITLAALALCLCACSGVTSEAFDPRIEPGAHHPPPYMQTEFYASETTLRLNMEFPHPGWSYVVDNYRLDENVFEVYLTIYRPDPRLTFPQVIKNAREDFSLEGAPRAHIYARTVELDLNDAEKPYRLAQTVEF